MANKRNYQNELDRIISSLDGTLPHLLLHVCCAPCSSYVLEYLSQYYEITVYFYNPNISPEREFRLRAEEEQKFLRELTAKYPIHYLEGSYDNSNYRNAVQGLEREPEGGKRCDICFRMRLEQTALLCSNGPYDCFTTTLTISPLKNAERLNAIGEEAAEKFHTVWLPCDFKKKNGYKRSVELSKEHGLYRQNYCGCIFSKSSP